ncbi:GFA family protein [Tabrizicola sp.]|uniref:GFA family protein n=1 Tax=Tabrizicola sp. TaxID=2005166 RepID=UPI001A548C57|nr:GFA family protein [Tabrizicola sp.]MBL9062195.1 GFA family protein [Tabrizicola sp.]
MQGVAKRAGSVGAGGPGALRRRKTAPVTGEDAMGEVETGGCLCGRVRFTTTGPLREVVFCHCSQCRRQSGLYFAATSVAADALILVGAEYITWFAASEFAKRGFCTCCGTILFWKPNAEPRYAVLAGAFDRPECLHPGYHICTERRPDFYRISDGLPQYPGDGPGVVTAAG